jgi:hypothetical protein
MNRVMKLAYVIVPSTDAVADALGPGIRIRDAAAFLPLQHVSRPDYYMSGFQD